MKKTYKTKFGELTRAKDRKQKNAYELLDSVGRILFNGCNNAFIKQQIERIKNAKEIGDWLSCFDDVCWGGKNEIKDFIKNYHEMNGRKFDNKWFEENYNKVGDTYVFFEYSDCFK